MIPVRHTLPREQRLRSKRLIDRLFVEGESGFCHPIRYVVLRETSTQPEVCVLVSVPKRHHKRAHTRNRLKRRLREAYRLQKEPLREQALRRGERIVLGLLYSGREESDYALIERSVGRILTLLVAETKPSAGSPA